MSATEMQILGIVLVAVGVVWIATAQILLSCWLKKVRKVEADREGSQ